MATASAKHHSSDRPHRAQRVSARDALRADRRLLPAAREDPQDIGVVLFTGAGDDAFCSGGDQRVRGDAGYVGEDDGVPRLNALDLQTCDPLLPEAGDRARGGLRDRRGPRAPPDLRPDHRRRQRALRPDRPEGGSASTPASARPTWRASSARRRPARSGTCASSTTPRRPCDMGLVNDGGSARRARGDRRRSGPGASCAHSPIAHPLPEGRLQRRLRRPGRHPGARRQRDAFSTT